MSRMFDRIERGEPAIGTITLAHGAELIELLGYVGFDFACIDLMVTSLDWGDVAGMVLAAKRYGVTPWVRLPAYPWTSNAPDPALPAQVLRALSLGAECVLASVNTAKQVEALLHPLTNAHRRVYILQNSEGRTEEQRRFDEDEAPQWVFPNIETLEAVERIDEIVKVRDLRMIALGMGDLSKELGHPEDDQHPEVREVVRRVTAKARDRGLVVCANTLAYKRSSHLSEMIAEGARYLWEDGVQVLWVPRPTMVLQRFYERTLEMARTRMSASAVVANSRGGGVA